MATPSKPQRPPIPPRPDPATVRGIRHTRSAVLMLNAGARAGNQVLTAILQPTERCLARQRQPGNANFLRLQQAILSQTHR